VSKKEIPKHIKDKIWQAIQNGVPYSSIAGQWQVSKSTVARVKEEFEKESGKQPEKKPISKNEIKRRENISKAVTTYHSLNKVKFISTSFIDAFQLITYNAEHLAEIIDHSKTEADLLKEKQEEILEAFKKYVELPPEAKADIVIGIKSSIQKINDFYARDMIRLKAVGEMRKHLETFLNLKKEIMEIETIKKTLDAFFVGCNVLNDADYVAYRNAAIESYPAIERLFMLFEAT
jgi:hypothetical protein